MGDKETLTETRSHDLKATKLAVGIREIGKLANGVPPKGKVENGIDNSTIRGIN